VQQELPSAVDQLPPAGHQARQLHRAGGEAHRAPPGPPRQQVRTGARIYWAHGVTAGDRSSYLVWDGMADVGVWLMASRGAA
jgi:hypothetical protein